MDAFCVLTLRTFGNIDLKDLEVLIEQLRAIGEKHGKSPAQVAVNWCICKGTIPICGVKNVKQVEENLGSVGWRLTEEEVKELDKLSISQPGNFWQD